MLEIKDLKANVADKQILNGVSLNFEVGKNYCILGKNGSGKSTLAGIIMGSPKYEVLDGEILIDGENLLEMEPEERSKKGIFLAFQNVPEIKGINLKNYLRIIYNEAKKSKDENFKEISPFIFERFIKKYLEELSIPAEFLERDLNVGFSGGEKRKIEILQMKLLEPKYIILDEIDSGLDLDAFRKVAELLKEVNSSENSIIIITHYFKILDYINVDEVIVMENGNIVKKGDVNLAKEISEKGFG